MSSNSQSSKKLPLLHEASKDKGFTARQDFCRISTDWLDNIYGIFKLVLYFGSMFLLFFTFSSLMLLLIKFLLVSKTVVNLIPESKVFLTNATILDLSIKISTAGAGFGIVGTYYTIWNGFWSNYNELRKQMLANPFLYDLWYNSDFGDPKVWLNTLSKEERVIVLIFLETWGDAYLSIQKWKMILHNYSIGFTEKAILVAQELNLRERGGYSLQNSMNLGIIPEDEIPPLVKAINKFLEVIGRPKTRICEKCRDKNLT